jgi:hypothetical protein
MRAVMIGAILSLLGITEVEAACHKYSRWYYPFPQRCRIIAANYEVPTKPTDPPLPPIPDSPNYDIPIPDMAGVWVANDQKELAEGLERKKALILLLGGH